MNPPQQQQSERPHPAPVFFAAGQPAELDSRLSDSAQDSLVSAFDNLRVHGRFPRRPSWGTTGTAVTLRSNHFAITYSNAKLYDYTVKIEPKPTIRRIRRRIFQLVEDAPEFAPFKNHVVHDSGGRLISSRPLPIPPNGLDVVIRHYDEDEQGPGPRSPLYVVSIAYNTQLEPEHLNK